MLICPLSSPLPRARCFLVSGFCFPLMPSKVMPRRRVLCDEGKESGPEERKEGHGSAEIGVSFVVFPIKRRGSFPIIFPPECRGPNYMEYT